MVKQDPLTSLFSEQAAPMLEPNNASRFVYRVYHGPNQTNTAGGDSVATSTSWVFWLVMNNRRVEKKIVDEIITGLRRTRGRDMAGSKAHTLTFLEMKSAASAILLRYKLSPVHGHQVLPQLSFTLSMKNGLKVNLKRRDLAAVL
ncbi:hypothetical protein RND71_023627 [Anisodus tanguticus]|uniref:Uncharacterized protein n=1 Tax=Anisodus tanguticus TaxID=243964 RepID=A0AAE1RV73_9SOLA|nr:hypothetical protein RND71_023627 [Anisodus tanguticus]